MADDRITWVALRKALAQKTGLSEATVATFLNQWMVSLLNGLKEDGQVKITGLGTFKIQRNAPRKSINIQTGEPILLEGYNKVVFTPETGLKDRINEPFSHLQAVVLDGTPEPVPTADPLQKLNEQAAEIQDLLNDLGVTVPQPETPVPEAPVPTPEPEVPVETVKPEPTPEPETPVVEPVKEPEQETPVQAPVAPIVPPPAPPQDEPEQETPKQAPKPFRPWLAAGITLLVFCALLVVGYFFLQYKLTTWADHLLSKTITTELPVPVPTSTLPAVETELETPLDSNALNPVENASAADSIGLSAPEQYTEFIKTETLTEGSRLTWLARKYYGAPDFWVYIYEANRAVIPDPNHIGVGTLIRIPKLPAELIDPNSEAALQLAKLKHQAILGE